MNIDDRNAELAYERKRVLWRFCAETLGWEVCYRAKHGAGCKPDCLRGGLVEKRLLAAMDDVPDLDVLIRKTAPDMLAFEESRMTTAERYRF